MLLVALFYALCCSCVLMTTLLVVKWRFGCGRLLMLGGVIVVLDAVLYIA